MVQRVIIALVFLAVLITTGASAVDDVYTDSGQTEEVTADFRGDPGDLITFQQSNIDTAFYDERVKVTNGSGVIMTEGEDYTWFEKNGTLEILSSNIDSTADNTIVFAYSVQQLRQTQYADYFGHVFDALPVLLIILAVIAIIAAMGRFT